MSKSRAKSRFSKTEKGLVLFHVSQFSLFTVRHGYVVSMGVSLSSPVLIFPGGFPSLALSLMAQQRTKDTSGLSRESRTAKSPAALGAWCGFKALLCDSPPPSLTQTASPTASTSSSGCAKDVGFLYISGGRISDSALRDSD